MTRIFVVLVVIMLFCNTVQAEQVTIEGITTLDLETAQRIALFNNPNLEAAAERVQQARQRQKQAKSLYFPSVDFTGGANSLNISENSAVRQGGIDRNQEQYSLGLGASWIVFDGFSRKFTNLIAEYGGEASVEAHREGQRLLLQSVAEGFYNAQLALYSKAIAEADMAFNSQQLSDAEVRYSNGSGALSTVLNFKVQINLAQTSLLTAQRDYEVTMFSLALLLGLEDGAFPDDMVLTELSMIPRDDYYYPELERLFEAALSSRPDLLTQELIVKQSEAQIGSAQSTYYPSLGLVGSVSGERYDDSSLEVEDFGTTIGLALKYNLYKGGADKAKIAESRAAKREATRLFQGQRNEIMKEVREAVSNLSLAQKQLTLQRQTTSLVTQTRDLVQEGYNAGQESLVRLNESQRDVVRTQSNLALSLVGLYRFRYRLETVTGSSLDSYPTNNM